MKDGYIILKVKHDGDIHRIHKTCECYLKHNNVYHYEIKDACDTLPIISYSGDRNEIQNYK